MTLTYLDRETLEVIAVTAIILGALLSGTHVITSLIRNVTHVHDTQVAVIELRNKYVRDAYALYGLPVPGEELGEVDIVDDDAEAPADDETPAETEGEPAEAATNEGEAQPDEESARAAA